MNIIFIDRSKYLCVSYFNNLTDINEIIRIEKHKLSLLINKIAIVYWSKSFNKTQTTNDFLQYYINFQNLSPRIVIPGSTSIMSDFLLINTSFMIYSRLK